MLGEKEEEEKGEEWRPAGKSKGQGEEEEMGEKGENRGEGRREEGKGKFQRKWTSAHETVATSCLGRRPQGHTANTFWFGLFY